MTWYNALIALGGLASAILSVAKLIAPIKKKIDDVMDALEASAEEQKKQGEEIKKLTEYSEDHRMDIWRLTIMNSEMPITERLIAGDKYIKHGGNGEVKAYYEKLVAEHTK